MVHRFEGEVGFGADLQHQRERHINLGGADFRAESDLDFWNWVYNDFREECQPPPQLAVSSRDHLGMFFKRCRLQVSPPLSNSLLWSA